MFKNFLSIGTNVLVKILPKKDKTVGGLYIPDNTPVNTQIAQVICPGNSTSLHVNDNVFFLKYQAHALDDTYMVVKEEFIMGVMND